MHGHYLLKLTTSLARVRKTPLYSIIFVRKFVPYLMGIISTYAHEVLSICHGYNIVLPELSEESYQAFSAQFSQ